ncbi:MAG: hypothetical protein EA359_08715 [Balneolaceae bacterium]|nr:MAG: hypothetical protein EA359_08715 [Balneolaceae bacterium]
MKAEEKQNLSADNNQSFTVAKKHTHEEFLRGIKAAEKGPFFTVQESMHMFEKWIKEREKK